jgi:predicted MPP superfamily phosphohydrolase
VLKPDLDVTRIVVPVPDLPESLDGFCIAHVSDIHVGDGEWLPFHIEEVSVAIQRERPDVVVNTGDYLVGEPDIDKVSEIAALLLIPSPAGQVGPANIGILGNHDYYAGDEIVDGLVGALGKLGVCILTNGTVCVTRDGAGVSFAGLVGSEPGFEDAAMALSKAPVPRVALLHEADEGERLGRGAVDLVLAGHSHGGQIAIPGITGWIVRHMNGSHYIDGSYRINGNPMYVNRGLGNTGLPIRFRAAPELAFLRLVR